MSQAQDVKKSRAKDVYKVLRARLIKGQWPPGTRVSELALSKEFGISRGPVREAIKDLAAEGFIEQVPNAGAFVKKPNRTEMEELFQVRSWLEGEAAATAATRISDMQLAEMERACAEMRAVADELAASSEAVVTDALRERIEVADAVFHLTLLEACGNRRAVKMLADQHMLTQLWSGSARRYNVSDLTSIHGQHTEVLRQVRSRDPQAARRAAREHVEQGCREALAVFDRAERERTIGKSTLDRWPTSLESKLYNIEEDKRG